MEKWRFTGCLGGREGVLVGGEVLIDPVTRLEGHGKIDIFLDDDGNVAADRRPAPALNLRG